MLPPSQLRSTTDYITEKTAGLEARPSGVVTVISPNLAPAGTAVASSVALSVAILAAVPSKLTAVAPERLIPLSVTAVLGLPEVGETLSIVGAVERITTPPVLARPEPQQSVRVGHDTAPSSEITVGRD
jgi:hypothetical protein